MVETEQNHPECPSLKDTKIARTRAVGFVAVRKAPCLHTPFPRKIWAQLISSAGICTLDKLQSR